MKATDLKPGDLVLIRYGNGTQVAKVREITNRGGVKIDRLWGGVEWRPSKTPIKPEEIIGPAPGSKTISVKAAKKAVEHHQETVWTPREQYADKIAKDLKSHGYTTLVRDDFSWHTVFVSDKSGREMLGTVTVYAPGKYSIKNTGGAQIEPTWDTSANIRALGLSEPSQNEVAVENDKGRKFLARIIKKGDRYGLNDKLVNKGETMIEISDLTHAKFGPRGQLVAQYRARDLESHQGGLDIQGGVPEWKLDAAAMAPIVDLARAARWQEHSEWEVSEPSSDKALANEIFQGALKDYKTTGEDGTRYVMALDPKDGATKLFPIDRASHEELVMLREKLLPRTAKEPSPMHQAPPGPPSGFGKEKTHEDIEARIAWDRWAAAKAREEGHEALAQGHDLSRVAYEKLLRRDLCPLCGEDISRPSPYGQHNCGASRRIKEPKPMHRTRPAEYSTDHRAHHRTMSRGRRQERAFLEMFNGWVHYAQAHEAEFGSPIGEDYVLGPMWEDIGKSLLGLLNGEIGGLDGGTMDGLIRQNLMRAGFEGQD